MNPLHRKGTAYVNRVACIVTVLTYVASSVNVVFQLMTMTMKMIIQKNVCYCWLFFNNFVSFVIRVCIPYLPILQGPLLFWHTASALAAP